MVTDVVMPQMSGRQLAVRLAALRPEMRVLYVSGYTDDAILQHGILEEGIDFLPKPYSPDQLAARVREILDRP
jgi:DNA-binding response OmpR family regulator